MPGTALYIEPLWTFPNVNRARTTMTEFFDKLRDDEREQQAIQLADTIPDGLLKSRVKSILALKFADLDPPTNLGDLLAEPSTRRVETVRRKERDRDREDDASTPESKSGTSRSDSPGARPGIRAEPLVDQRHRFSATPHWTRSPPRRMRLD